MLNVIMLNVIVLNVIMLNAVMLDAIMLDVMLNVLHWIRESGLIMKKALLTSLNRIYY